MVLRFSMGFVIAIMVLLSACAGPAGVAGSAGPAGPAGPPGAASEIRAATLVITPMSGLAGKTKLTIYGSGFVPEENVRVILGIEGADIGLADRDTGGIVVADDKGAFKLKNRGGIPRKEVINPGVYTVKAIGDKGSMASAPLEVVAP